jgi:uncharacterized Zn finger protein
MSAPCCPKCSNTNFLRNLYHALNAYLIYCSKCGAVVGALPYSLKTTGKSNMSTGASGGKTASDAWTSTT